jgi:hypothetical protein
MPLALARSDGDVSASDHEMEDATMMTPIPQQRRTRPDQTPTRPDLPAMRMHSTIVPRLPPSETTPTPLLPPPGPQPARRSISPDDVLVPLPEDGALGLLLETVPRIIRSKDELSRAPIEHRDWYVLALLDGQTSVQGIVDISGMDPDDVLRILQRLRRLALITLI